MNARQVWRRLLMAVGLVGAPLVPVLSSAPGAMATAPSAAVCNGDNLFCGWVLHAKNGSTTVLPTKAFGAHMGGLWAMPGGANNSTGVGFCLDDSFGGVPVGSVSELPLPAWWSVPAQAEAAWIVAMYAGDRVAPYQPLAIDGSGELAGWSTRQRYLAVHLALLSVLPNHNANGTYSPLLDPWNLHLYANAAGTIPSSTQAVVPLVQQIAAAAVAHHATGSEIVLTARVTAVGTVTVTATKDGLPVADLPVWPTWPAGVTYTGTTSTPAWLNAQAAGWPALDYSTTHSAAGVTNAAGQATFNVSTSVLASGVEFNTEEPPASVHNWGDGQASQANLTWVSGENRRYAADAFDRGAVQLASQISDSVPVPGEVLSDSLIVDLLAPGVGVTMEVQLFDLTVDPSGSGVPLAATTYAVNGNGVYPGVAPWTVTAGQMGHRLGYRHRVLEMSDGSLPAPTEWSVLGDPTETATVSALVEATVHLRKTVSADGGPWYNAQGDALPAWWPSPAPDEPWAGSFDDASADAGDGVPVYAAGSLVRFRYEVWLEESSGAVTWPASNGPMILDDNGTPADKLDDWAPVLVAGDDDGDGSLAGGEVWVLESPVPITATAGEQYRNMSVLYPGLIHRLSNPAGPIEGYSQFRWDPAGFDVPAITTSVDAGGGARRVNPTGGVLVDTVTYDTVVPGEELAVDGEVMRVWPDGSTTSTGITGRATFTPASPAGTVEVPFTLPAGMPAGTYVVFERLTFENRLRAVHEDPTDALQTFEVVVPVVTTSVSSDVDGGRVVGIQGGPVTDHVCYSDLLPAPGAVVTAVGELQLLADDGSVSPAGITGTAPVTTTPAGCVDVAFTVPAGGPARYVVYEQVFVDGVTVAAHEDPDDAMQTFDMVAPSITTVATSNLDGTHYLGAQGGTITDAVCYSDLYGATGRVDGELQRIDPLTGLALPTGITSSATFIPAGPVGCVDVAFVLSAGRPVGHFVVFEVLTVDGVTVASHTDPTDADQAFELIAPTITTTVTSDLDGTHFLGPQGGTVTDEVCFTDLYTADAAVEGQLWWSEAGEPMSATGITASVEFTPAGPQGCVEVPFAVPASPAGGRYVVYERLLADGVQVAEHADPDDPAQAFEQVVPTVVTTVTSDLDGTHSVGIQGGTVTDRVCYTHLHAFSAMVEGELQRIGLDGTVTSTGITGRVAATDTPQGCVDVGFTVPPTPTGGRFVVFERLVVNGTVVAVHEDPTDPAQTFDVVVPSVSTSVSNSADGSQYVSPAGGSMVDHVCYEGVYAPLVMVRGEVQRIAADGSIVPTGVIASATFAPMATAGCVDVAFTVPASPAGGLFVVFEQLLVGGAVVAVHEDPSDVSQQFVQRREVSVSTSACRPEVELAVNGTVGANCDVVVLGGDPGDVITGTLYAVQWVDGARDCSNASVATTWQVTIDADGLTTVTPNVASLPTGDWEFLHAARAAGARSNMIPCDAAVARNLSESFRVIPNRNTPGNDIPSAGVTVVPALAVGAGLVALGALLLAVTRRRLSGTA